MSHSKLQISAAHTIHGGTRHRTPVAPDLASIRGPRWSRASREGVGQLHHLYERTHTMPFFIEISGPDPGMSRNAFIAWCLDDGAMWLAQEGKTIVGFLWFSYIQRTLGVANVDWSFFDGYPPHNSRQDAIFQEVFHCARHDLGLRKLHLLALTDQQHRIRLAREFGFVQEGCLREHFFHDGALRDLLCLGYTEAGDAQG